MDDRWLTTAEASARLGIKPASLYSYVSRGAVTRHTGPDGRTSRFAAAEVEQLARRGRPRRSSRDPVVDVAVASAITDVPPGAARRWGHRYRGRHAVTLARHASFEEVAGLLIDGDLRPLVMDTAAPGSATAPNRDGGAAADPLVVLRRAVDEAAQNDPFRADLNPAAVRATAGAVLGSVVDAAAPVRTRIPALVLADGAVRRGSVAARLAVSLGGRTRPAPWVVEGVNAALVLLADHELATSTLAARVAASTRADPYACVVSALATLSGPLHGTASSLVRAALGSDDPAAELAAHAGTGRLPGFGHPLYERADPRAVALVDRVRAAVPDHPALRSADRLVDAVERRAGIPPNVDLGLAVFTAAAGMVAPAGTVLFAVARTAGWLAHVAEEYAEPALRFRSRSVAVPGAYPGPATWS